MATRMALWNRGPPSRKSARPTSRVGSIRRTAIACQHWIPSNAEGERGSSRSGPRCPLQRSLDRCILALLYRAPARAEIDLHADGTLVVVIDHVAEHADGDHE